MTIPQTFDEAFARVDELVSIFTENEPHFLSRVGTKLMSTPVR